MKDNSFKIESKSFYEGIKHCSKYATSTTYSTVMLYVMNNLNRDNIFSLPRSFVSKKLKLSNMTLGRIYKLFEESNFWYKHPDNKRLYFVNPNLYAKTKNPGYRETLCLMYENSKKYKGFLSDLCKIPKKDNETENE